MIEGGKISRFVGLIWRLNWPSFLFFGFTRLLFWRRAIDVLQSMTQRGDKEFYKLLRYFISYRVKTLKLTVTSNLGTFGGGGGDRGIWRIVRSLKNPGYPPDKYFWNAEESIPGFFTHVTLSRQVRRLCDCATLKPYQIFSKETRPWLQVSKRRRF